jgi:hypothetical protein
MIGAIADEKGKFRHLLHAGMKHLFAFYGRNDCVPTLQNTLPTT